MNKYRQLASEKRSTNKIHEVSAPSGFVWKLRDPPIQQFIAAGRLPSSLVAKFAAVARAKGSGLGDMEAVHDFTPDELINMLQFTRDLLIYCAVDPKISLNPQNEDELDPIEIIPEDFEFLTNWLMTGGTAGESLGTFPVE